MTIIMDKAELQLADLLTHVTAGDEILITQDGKPIARVAPVTEETPLRTTRVPGIDADKRVVPDDIVAPLPDNLVQTPAQRVPGSAIGEITVPLEFYEPLPDDILDDFYNGKIEP